MKYLLDVFKGEIIWLTCSTKKGIQTWLHSFAVLRCQNVINLNYKSGELNGVPTSTWNISTQQSWARMQVTIFTSKPHMSTIFHVGRQLEWKNIQWDEWTKLVSKVYRYMERREEWNKREIVVSDTYVYYGCISNVLSSNQFVFVFLNHHDDVASCTFTLVKIIQVWLQVPRNTNGIVLEVTVSQTWGFEFYVFW